MSSDGKIGSVVNRGRGYSPRLFKDDDQGIDDDELRVVSDFGDGRGVQNYPSKIVSKEWVPARPAESELDVLKRESEPKTSRPDREDPFAFRARAPFIRAPLPVRVSEPDPPEPSDSDPEDDVQFHTPPPTLLELDDRAREIEDE